MGGHRPWLRVSALGTPWRVEGRGDYGDQLEAAAKLRCARRCLGCVYAYGSTTEDNGGGKKATRGEGVSYLNGGGGWW